MPVVGASGVNFGNYFIPLAGTDARPRCRGEEGRAVLAYGNFVTVALNFAILAFIIFIMVRQVSRMRKAAPLPPPAAPEDVVLLREIRDALRKSHACPARRGSSGAEQADAYRILVCSIIQRPL